MTYTFRKIKAQDALKFKNWGAHEDVRYYQYNFPFEHDADYYYWYVMKQRPISRKVYGLFDEEDQPVGFITLKHFKWLKRTAEMGIGIDPKLLSRGLGRKLIEAFLDHVFKHYPLKSIELRVAEFNTRAQKCYLASGFEQITKVTQPFEEQSFKDEIMAKYPDQFFISDHVLYTTFFVMEVTRNRFFSLGNGKD